MAAESRKSRQTGCKLTGHVGKAAGKTKSTISLKQTAAKPAVISKKVDKSVLKDSKESVTIPNNARSELTTRSSLLTTNEVDFDRRPAPPRTKAPRKLTQTPKDDVELFKASDSAKNIKRKSGEPTSDQAAVSTSAFKTSKKRKLEAGTHSKPVKSTLASKSSMAHTKPDAWRVEHLSYKRLMPGPTVVLAQIVQILPLELVLSLPNQLLGHVPITNISPFYTERLEHETDESDADSDNDEGEASSKDGTHIAKLPSLSDMFEVGQYLRASVVHVLPARITAHNASIGTKWQRTSEDWRASRRCELSLYPELVNAGIEVEDLNLGQFTLQACVKSEEDHGVILDLGVKVSDGNTSALRLSAFMSKQEITNATKGKHNPATAQRAFTTGGVISVRIVKLADNGRTATVSIKQADIDKCLLTAAPQIASLTPGALIQASVTSVLHSGLNLRFLDFFEGSVDTFHMQPGRSYKVGDKVRARILWTSTPASDAPIRFSCSLLQHIVDLVPKMVPIPGLTNSNGSQPMEIATPIGTIFEAAEVVKIEAEWGLLLRLAAASPDVPPLTAWAHISHVADEHISNLRTDSFSTRYKVGSTHRARVTGYSGLDGILQVSLQPSVLERKFMQINDLHVGDILKGKIQHLTDSALFVNIGGNVPGIVWPAHYADIKLKHPERRFKAGGIVIARVFALDSDKRRVVLTLRRSLVQSELPVLQCFEEAREGMLLQATVQAFLPNDKDLLVELFGGQRAFVPVKEASTDLVESISSLYSVGKPVVIRLIKVDPDRRRLTASIRRVSEAAIDKAKPPARTKADNVKAPMSDISHIAIGAVISGIVTDVHENQVVMNIGSSQAKALVSVTALAKHMKITTDELRQAIAAGKQLENLKVFSKNVEKGICIVAPVSSNTQRSMLSKGISGNVNSGLTLDDLHEGQILPGTMGQQTPQGYFVQLSQRVRGKVSTTELADDYDEVVEMDLKPGSSVQCHIIRIDQISKRIELSLRQSRRVEALANSAPVDPVIENVEALAIGQKSRGFVKAMNNAGLWVDIGHSITARVQIKELFDEFVDDWKACFSIGQVVSGRIVGTNPSQNQVEMSLRTNSSAIKIKTNSTMLADLFKGQLISGVVKNIESFGVFIRIDGAMISGLCHRSNMDSPPADLATVYSIGQPVQAVVQSVDSAKSKIGFSLKAAELAGAGATAVVPKLDAIARRIKQLKHLEDASDDDRSEGESRGSNDEDYDDNEDADEDDNVDDSADDLDIVLSNDAQSPAGDVQYDLEATDNYDSSYGLDLPAISWNVSDAQHLHGGNLQNDTQYSDDESDSEQSDSVTLANNLRKDGILVNDRTGSLTSRLPATTSDFDRLLLASPDSSEIWVRYMAHYLESSDIHKARSTGQRALTTINYRQEDDRLNVWMALLNLEIVHGTEESFQALFDKATKANDDKQVYTRTLQALDQVQFYAKEEALFERFVKKFPGSSKSWTMYATYLYARQRSSDARELLTRGLKSLPKRKHIKAVTQFALLEYRSGDVERARTIFEGIVNTYPKRLDLWLVYIDQEVRLRNIANVRALFERLVSQKQSSKKSKSIFKKWLSLEKQYGDVHGEQTVKDKAVAFVSAMADKE